jgi:uncharacterized membrane protein YedE/YeeE
MKAKIRSQRKLLLFVTVVIMVLALALYAVNPRLPLFLFFGGALGFTLQRARFCFAAAFRDVILVGITAASRGVLIFILMTVVGVALIQYSYDLTSDSILSNVDPVGWHTVVGGILFGIGMVIAGGCVSGTFMRMGEGYEMQWYAFIGLVIGAGFGGKHFYWWHQWGSYEMYLPNYFGWWPSLVLSLVLLLGLYLLAHWWEKKEV